MRPASSVSERAFMVGSIIGFPVSLGFVWPSWLVAVITVLFLAICIVMVLTVLIQKPQGGGLASAFGGGASAGQTAFGTKTGDALTVFTITVFVLYLIGAVILNYAARPQLAPPSDPALIAPGEPSTPPVDTGRGVEVVPAPADGATPPVNPPESAPSESGSSSPTTTPEVPPPGSPATDSPTAPPPAPGNEPENPEPKTAPGR